MKINSINSYTHNNSKIKFKSQSNSNNGAIKFSETDMERGSMIGGLAGFLLSSFHLDRINEKNLFKAGLISAATISLTMFATMGIITFVKIMKSLKNNQN